MLLLPEKGLKFFLDILETTLKFTSLIFQLHYSWIAKVIDVDDIRRRIDLDDAAARTPTKEVGKSKSILHHILVGSSHHFQLGLMVISSQVTVGIFATNLPSALRISRISFQQSLPRMRMISHDTSPLRNG